jgi:hypothetical protein
MFGNASQPSRIYSYGAKAPVQNAELVGEQMWKAHRYRNKLVELELERRKEVDEAVARLSPDLQTTESALAVALQALELARTEIKKQNAQARSRKHRSPELVALVETNKALVKELRAKRKALRQATFESEAWKTAQLEINERANERQKAAREACGLYWGTYLLVETSMSKARSGAPPRFARWRGDGHLAVQLQGGMSPAEAFAGTDPRLRIEPMPTQGNKRERKRTRVWFRVGSQGRDPVWAVMPVILHRPIPADSRIKWVHIIRHRIATQCRWRVQFVLSKSSWVRSDQAEHGTVGIDIGWRMMVDRSMRVAYWTGDDGREGELRLPADWLGEYRRTEKIGGHRDDNFNAIKAVVVPAIAAMSNRPEWLTGALSTMSQWRSTARLAALALKWRESRFAGDENVYGELEAWRKRDKHLMEFQFNLRDQLLARRLDIYRNFAAKMRRAYRTAMLEDLDLRDFHVSPQAEEDAKDGALREHTRDAALSILIRCVKESMAQTIFVDAKNTTRKCDQCGTIQDWDHRELYRECVSCKKNDDQDRIASRNLLASGSVANVVGSDK